MQEVGGSVRSDRRLGDVSPVGLESELNGDGGETKVEDDTTPPVRSSPSGAGVEPEAAPRACYVSRLSQWSMAAMRVVVRYRTASLSYLVARPRLCPGRLKPRSTALRSL